MPILQCGFIANGSGEAGHDHVSTAIPSSVISSNDLHLGMAFPGGWGFGLASCSNADSEGSGLCCWGVNAPTVLWRRQGMGFGRSLH